MNQPVITATRAAQMNDARLAAKRAAEARFKQISVWMFINAVLLGLEAALFWSIIPIAGISAAAVGVIYVMLAVSARHMNKTVFLLGMLAYAAQTGLYVLLLFTTAFGPFILLRPLIIKVPVLYRLNSLYGELKAYHED